MAAANQVILVYVNGERKVISSSTSQVLFQALGFTSDGADHGLTISDVAGAFDFNAKPMANIGGITLASGTVTGLAAPSAASDAATKTYTDTGLALKLALAGGTMSGSITMSGGSTITGLPSPVGATDSVNKAYVDNQAQAVTWKNVVRSSTTAALPTYTYANGTSGVGATLTATTNAALAAQDGVTLVVGDRLLVKNEAGASLPNNGIYTVTAVGDGTHPYILTRALDCDDSDEFTGATVEVGPEATAQKGQVYRQTDATITVGTTNVDWILTNNAQAVTYGSGLYQSGAVIYANPDGTTLDATGPNLNGNPTLEIKALGVGTGQLAAASVTTAKLGTITDGVTLDQVGSGSTLEVKALGIGTAQIAASAVTAAKLGAVTDGVTLDTSGTGSSLEIKAQGVGPTQLGAVAGTGLAGGSGAALSVDYTMSLTNDNAGAVTVGQVVYVKANGHIDLATATTASLSDSELGIVQDASIAAAAAGKVIVKRGDIVGGFSSLTPGKMCFVSTTGGAVTQDVSTYTASGDYIYAVGRAVSATQIAYNPDFQYQVA